MVIYSYHFVILVSFCVTILGMSRLDMKTRRRLKALKRAKNFAPNTPKTTSIVQVKKVRHFESDYKANTSKSGQHVSLAIRDASKPLELRKSTAEELAILSKLSTPSRPTAKESALIASKWGTVIHDCKASPNLPEPKPVSRLFFILEIFTKDKTYRKL